MNIFRRVLGPVVFASLVLAASGCTDDGNDATIDIAIPGVHGYVLVGPADRAEKLAERLAHDMDAPAPFHRDDAAGRPKDLVLEAPHGAWIDPVRLEEIAAAEGFAVLESPAP